MMSFMQSGSALIQTQHRQRHSAQTNATVRILYTATPFLAYTAVYESPSILPTHVFISSSPYTLNPLSLVTLASCTLFASSFSSITCLSVFSTNSSASCSVNDL